MILYVLRHYTDGTTDTYGNEADKFAGPEEWDVRGVAPGAMVEPNEPNRDASDIAWTVYADATDAVPTERDRVEFLGDLYDVAGRPADWTHGPWANPVAGVVVELTRREG